MPLRIAHCRPASSLPDKAGVTDAKHSCASKGVASLLSLSCSDANVSDVNTLAGVTGTWQNNWSSWRHRTPHRAAHVRNNIAGHRVGWHTLLYSFDPQASPASRSCRSPPCKAAMKNFTQSRSVARLAERVAGGRGVGQTFISQLRRYRHRQHQASLERTPRAVHVPPPATSMRCHLR